MKNPYTTPPRPIGLRHRPNAAVEGVDPSRIIAPSRTVRGLTTNSAQLHELRGQGFRVGYAGHDGKGAQARRLRQMERQRAKAAKRVEARAIDPGAAYDYDDMPF